ncbi:MAG TPA: DUF4097 family beta strand repeat-containing protein [Candidatus Acidoferrales bacterium]|nr:DUF4097 family beta strand repeat-containing protein [Candidatus Acidoferrales bacterium]
MKLAPICLAALLLVASAPAVRAGDDDLPGDLAERSVATADVGGISRIELRNPRGITLIRPSADGLIHVAAVKICRMPTPSEARRYAALTLVHLERSAGTYRVRVEYPGRIDAHLSLWDVFSESGRRRLGKPRVEVRLTVEVPAGLPLDVETVSGDVDSDGLAAREIVTTSSGDVIARATGGPISVQTSSGDVRLEGSGGADVRTSSGDIWVGQARGRLDLRSESGDLTVAQAPAGVRASSASGEVLVRAASGPVHLSTESGNMRVWLRGPLGETQLSSGSGDVHAVLADGISATLEAASASGAIDCSGPLVVLQHGENRLRARVGRGGAPIVVNTESGGLTVTCGGM